MDKKKNVKRDKIKHAQKEIKNYKMLKVIRKRKEKSKAIKRQAECRMSTEIIINRQLRDEIEHRKRLEEKLQISEVRFRRLFETAQFEQFGEMLKSNNRGIGLGLAITKDIVELSKGKIWVESELGKGTKFSFTIQNIWR